MLCSLAYQRLDLRPWPAAHRKLFLAAFQDHRPSAFALGFGSALDTADRSPRHQTIAMNPHEHAAEFLFELCQRLLDQVLAAAGAQSNVLELCSQVNHVRDSHEGHAPALGDAEVAARGRIDALEHSAGESRARYGFLQGRKQPYRTNRFGQVVHGIDLKRLDRVAVVRGDEND